MSAFEACQKLLALALLLQCTEMLRTRVRIAAIWLEGRALGLTLLLLAQALVALLAFWDARAFPAALALQLILLAQLRGPYAGASDAMTLQALIAVSGAVLLPEFERAFLFYLALQVTLSLFLGGLHKARHRQWWNGEALMRALRLETLDVPGLLRSWTKFPAALRAMGWTVVLFELVFPVVLFTPSLRAPFIALALAFHAFNAYSFGLNRFFWAWVAAYPAILALPH